MARRSRADRESAVAKVRVYELAKEFGVESKAVMAKLQEMGEFVRSASSTIEAPVVRRLKEAFATQQPKQARAGARGDTRVADSAAPAGVTAAPAAAAPVAPAAASPSAADAVAARDGTNRSSPAVPAAPAETAAPPPGSGPGPSPSALPADRTTGGATTRSMPLAPPR